MKRFIILITLLFSTTALFCQEDISGLWESHDGAGNRTGEIKLYMKDGLLYGTITKAYHPKTGEEISDMICEGCRDKYNGQNIIGMTVVCGLEYDCNKEAYCGHSACFAPEKNMIANCKIWLDKEDHDIIYLRGYLGILFETQKWYRLRR